MDEFNQQVLQNATQNIHRLNALCDEVEQPVMTIVSRIEQAQVEIQLWQQQIESSMALAMKHMTEAITQGSNHFSTEIISFSTEALTTLNDDLQQLNHSVEQWEAFVQKITEQAI
jgi:Cys-tRNA synthase (O-phospho-L-seryl-tRNA:Cys-tRNA synthase)